MSYFGERIGRPPFFEKDIFWGRVPHLLLSSIEIDILTTEL